MGLTTIRTKIETKMGLRTNRSRVFVEDAETLTCSVMLTKLGKRGYTVRESMAEYESTDDTDSDSDSDTDSE